MLLMFSCSDMAANMRVPTEHKQILTYTAANEQSPIHSIMSAFDVDREDGEGRLYLCQINL